jgi:YYY domain-containing protein
MSAVLAFWAVSLLIGLVALPIAFALLRRLPDAGAGLSIALGLVLTSYLYFILRVAHVLPFGRGGYVVAVALVALVSAAVAGRDRRFLSTLRRTWPGWVAAAGLFTFFFFCYVAVRSYNSEINGTEQPMDFMYLNATLTSKDYPPHDSWLAGDSASYYYFGYVQIGVLTSVSGVPASTGYNLGLAYTFAAAATAIASLGYALARWAVGSRGRRWAIAAGGLAVGLLLFLGSLSAIFEVAAAHGATNDDLYGKFGVEWLIPCAAGQTQNCFNGDLVHRADHWYPTEFWFWWRGSRIIPSTITEFPFFSFLLGDMHPHVMSIPLVLLSIGLSISIWRGRRPLSWRTHRRNPALGLVLAVIFGALAFANAWDVLTFSAVLAVAVLVRNMRVLPGLSRREGARLPGLPSLQATASFLVPMALVAIVLYIPWYLDFSSQAGGLAPYAGKGTRPAHAFLQFGPLLAAALLTLTWAYRKGMREHTFNAGVGALWLPLVPFILWLGLSAYRSELRDGLDARSASGWFTLIGYGATTWLLLTCALVLRERKNAGAAVAALAAVGVLLLYGSELFYISDIFEGSAPRLNTVFKLTYQAWMLLSLAGAVAFVVALRNAGKRRAATPWLAVPVAVLVGGGLVYAATALPNRTEGFRNDTAVDGLAFLARSSCNEYPLTNWVEENTQPDDLIIEGSGRRWTDVAGQPPTMVDANVDYTDAGRIAGRTGRQTLIGWYFHEIQWRGDTQSVRTSLLNRQADVDAIYTQSEPARVLKTLQDSGAKYVVVGCLEHDRYPANTMANFATFLDVAYDKDGLRVYRVPAPRIVNTS